MRRVSHGWILMAMLTLIGATPTDGQNKLQQQASKFLSMGAGLGLETAITTTTTTTTSTTARPGPPAQDNTDDFSIEDMTPKQQFIREGHLYTETLVGHITINIRFRDLSARIDVAERAAKKIASKSRQRVQEILPAWQATIDQLTEVLNFFSVQKEEVDQQMRPMSRSFADDPGSIDLHNINALKRYVVKHDQPPPTETPKARSMAGVLGGVLGLYNTVEGKSTHQLAEANSKAIKKVMESVDALREFGDKNSQRLDTTLEELMQISQLNSQTSLELYWEQTRDLIRAAGQVAMGATQQRLDPAILAIVDMENIWQGFIMKVSMDEWVPAFQYSQHLYQVRASFIGSTESVKIQVHVPMRQEKATRWELLRFIPRPIYQEGVMFTILPIKARLAVDPVTHAYMELEQDTFDSCNSIPGEMYCPDTVRVVHMANSGSCLAAIWSEVWTTIEETCWIQARKPTITAWAEGPNRFVVISPTLLTVHVACPHRPARSATVNGYKMVRLASGCILTTEVFTLHAGNETMDERFHVEVDTEGSSSMIRNATLNLDTGERLAKLKRPMAVHSVAAEVSQILQEGRNWHLFGKTTWVAIALSIVALVTIVGFIAFLWCRIKFANMSAKEVGHLTRNTLRRTWSRRPRWRARTTAQVEPEVAMEMSERKNNKRTDDEHIAQFDGNDDIDDVETDAEMEEITHRVSALLMDVVPVSDKNNGAFWTGPATVWIEHKTVDVLITQEVQHSYIRTELYHALRDWWPWGEFPPTRVNYNFTDNMRWTDRATVGIKRQATKVNLRMFVSDDIDERFGAILGTDFLIATRIKHKRDQQRYDCCRAPAHAEPVFKDPTTPDIAAGNEEDSLFKEWPDISQATEWEFNYDDHDWEPEEKIRRPDTPRPRIEVDDEGIIRRPGHGRGKQRLRWARGWKSHWAEW